jgi:hypothetical protein
MSHQKSWKILLLLASTQFLLHTSLHTFVAVTKIRNGIVIYGIMQLYEYLKFQVFTASSAFWDTAPCSLVEVDQRFRGAYCLYNQGDYRNVGLLQRDYTPLYSIRLSSLCEYVLSIISALWQFGVFRIGLFYAFIWHLNIRTTAHYQALNPCSFNKCFFFPQALMVQDGPLASLFRVS